MVGIKAVDTNVIEKAKDRKEVISGPAKVVVGKVGTVGKVGKVETVGKVGKEDKVGKVVVGKEEVVWGQMLRVTLHTTTK